VSGYYFYAKLDRSVTYGEPEFLIEPISFRNNAAVMPLGIGEIRITKTCNYADVFVVLWRVNLRNDAKPPGALVGVCDAWCCIARIPWAFSAG
jgi:hypothetical protein